MIYAVTGATGAFGTLAIRHLLAQQVPASAIVALARSQAKAEPLAELGVQVRLADYDQPAALEQALQGVDRLLLVSGSEVGKRVSQHENVITAAKNAGVKLLAYTSLNRANTSVNPLAGDHKSTEALIQQSGVPFVFLRNNWYTENYTDALKLAQVTGVIEAAVGTGKVASALRSEYAEAAAHVLVGEGHEGQIYELAGELWDYDGLAQAAAEVLGRPVAYKAVSAAERVQSLLAVGLPEGTAGFVAALEESIAAGSLDQSSGDLAQLLGRQPQGLVAGVRACLS